LKDLPFLIQVQKIRQIKYSRFSRKMTRRIDATEKLSINKILQQKHGDLMFYQAGGCCEGTTQCFEKEVLSKIRDICIGSIENTEFWVTRIYSNIGNIRTLL
jgi:uncharacterized protein (DUF779 family)